MNIGRSIDLEWGLVFRCSDRELDSTGANFVHMNANFVPYDLNVFDNPIQLFPNK